MDNTNDKHLAAWANISFSLVKEAGFLGNYVGNLTGKNMSAAKQLAAGAEAKAGKLSQELGEAQYFHGKAREGSSVKSAILDDLGDKKRSLPLHKKLLGAVGLGEGGRLKRDIRGETREAKVLSDRVGETGNQVIGKTNELKAAAGEMTQAQEQARKATSDTWRDRALTAGAGVGVAGFGASHMLKKRNGQA